MSLNQRTVNLHLALTCGRRFYEMKLKMKMVSTARGAT
jgi:hypothetical protein